MVFLLARVDFGYLIYVIFFSLLRLWFLLLVLSSGVFDEVLVLIRFGSRIVVLYLYYGCTFAL